MTWFDNVRETHLQRVSGPVGRCAAGISTCMLGITVAAMAVAQSGGNFKAAPKPLETKRSASGRNISGEL